MTKLIILITNIYYYIVQFEEMNCGGVKVVEDDRPKLLRTITAQYNARFDLVTYWPIYSDLSNERCICTSQPTHHMSVAYFNLAINIDLRLIKSS